MHVDHFIYESNYGEHLYARWVLMHFRLPAVLQLDFGPFMKSNRLFCDFEGQRYRCTGASRMGDVWLATDFKREAGYDLRVDVAECSNWGAEP